MALHHTRDDYQVPLVEEEQDGQLIAGQRPGKVKTGSPKLAHTPLPAEPRLSPKSTAVGLAQRTLDHPGRADKNRPPRITIKPVASRDLDRFP